MLINNASSKLQHTENIVQCPKTDEKFKWRFSIQTIVIIIVEALDETYTLNNIFFKKIKTEWKKFNEFPLPLCIFFFKRFSCYALHNWIRFFFFFLNKKVLLIIFNIKRVWFVFFFNFLSCGLYIQPAAWLFFFFRAIE